MSLAGFFKLPYVRSKFSDPRTRAARSDALLGNLYNPLHVSPTAAYAGAV